MIICVTDRLLCAGDFYKQLEKIVELGVGAIILREKDLDDDSYEAMARRCMAIAEAGDVPLILHSRSEVAKRLGIKRLHLPFGEFVTCSGKLDGFNEIGVSVHSVEEAAAAEEGGATYLIAGHIYETGCKEGLAPRGLGFLREICKAVSIPVYAIGGINSDRLDEVMKAGARGGCIRSGLMDCI